MTQNKRTNGFIQQWENSFIAAAGQNFKAMLMANLLFAVPLLASIGIAALVGFLINQYSVFVFALPVIFAFPFFAGVTQITKDIAKNALPGEKINSVESFKKGIKNNWKLFLVHGIVFYVLTLITYFSVVVYWSGGSVNSVLYVMFGVSVLIGLVLLFMMYLIPLMTVTIELPLTKIYKNAALMAFGELPQMLLLTVFLVFLILVLFSISMLFQNSLISLIVFSLLGVFVAPSMVSLLINYRLYPRIKKLFVSGEEHSKAVLNMAPKEQHTAVFSGEDSNTTGEMQFEQEKNVKFTKDGEYIFHDGRMVRRGGQENYNLFDETD